MSSIADTLNSINNSTARTQFDQQRQNMGSSKLDKDAFLQLLLAQLRYQDPTNPVDDKEFITQQAAFTQIESLNNLNATMTQANQISQASSLVGKTVNVKFADNSTYTGRIDSAQIGASSVSFSSGDKTFTSSQITGIVASP